MITISCNKAADILLNGGNVAIPTETVYGLAALYDNLNAVQRIYSLKQRPLTNPLIMHVANYDQLLKYTTDVPPYLEALANAHMPGPLTVVLNKRASVPDLITAKQNTVAIRIPNHPLTLDLLNTINKPIVAPSANPYCQLSPTKADHVYHHFGNTVSILDGGNCAVGIESTIILATNQTEITVLRPGILDINLIQHCAGVPCISHQKTTTKHPGQNKVHYSPRTPLYSVDDYKVLQQLSKQRGQHYCFLLLNNHSELDAPTIRMPLQADHYAQRMYDALHQADQQHFDAIIIERPPYSSEWDGIQDRINKAAQDAKSALINVSY